MSATAETHKFSQYLDNCPVINIPGRAFPVKAHYLEEIVEMTGTYIFSKTFIYHIHLQNTMCDI